ncbi:uncharacterized protein LOC126737220 [Anthonomus grandis grandis]|uniref:uncharacterized protein LOC126737220 n=1 Tax=Anthonomus grandis grandis TaxID=2921223 RepID=UPI00216582F9|nr:uncharacterized protein LOC126737220 [Anthonomus grandis grandis]
MLLNCLKCSNLQKLTARTLKTTPAMFLSQGRRQEPQKKSRFQLLKEKQQQTMTIQNLPETESVGTILKVQKHNQEIPKGFKTVYKFPWIKYFGLVNRLKVYQTVFTGIGVSSSGLSWAFGLCDASMFYTVSILGFSGCVFLYSLGMISTNFVGFIYYNDDTDMVRIAYVDYWGRRRDIEVHTSDIIHSDESPVRLINKVWFPLKRHSTSEILKLQLETGIILDKKALNRIV